MSREINTNFAPHAKQFIDTFHSDVVEEVRDAILTNDVVVVGMSANVSVKRVRQALDAHNIQHVYLEYGGYLSKWKERLAIKIWSGWPTYPQVFVKGTLMGGNQLTQKALNDGSLETLLTS